MGFLKRAMVDQGTVRTGPYPVAGKCRLLASGCRVLAVLSLLVVLFLSGCVTTAECDSDAGCGAEEVCFQLQCKSRCSEEQPCHSGECIPCEGADGSQNYCQDENLSACVENEEIL